MNKVCYLFPYRHNKHPAHASCILCSYLWVVVSEQVHATKIVLLHIARLFLVILLVARTIKYLQLFVKALI